MPSPFLSKTDFKCGFDCAAKLHYRKLDYPSALQDNDYLQFLADSGFMIETIAKAQFPQGVDLADERNPGLVSSRTRELLTACESSVVFEGGFLHGRLYARADILRREGKTLHLMEVKSSSLNTDQHTFRNKGGSVIPKWKPYLIDVTFQLHVLRHAFPDFEIRPWLWLVDKTQPVRECETVGRFSISRPAGDVKSRPQVHYSGKPAELLGTRILKLVDVSEETELLMGEVVQRAEELAAMLDAEGRMQRPPVKIHECYKACKKCEFRFPEGKAPGLHGFAECWGEMASAKPHVLDLHRVTQIGTANFDDPVPVLLSKGKASLLDLREDQLGAPGARTERRLIQWAHSANGGKEHLPPALRTELSDFATSPGYPFHFLDFEACDVVLPHHAGLHPYERVAFQWSCHTLGADGNLTHQEWLNTERSFPSFQFARALRACIGDSGTVFVWSHYELTTLVKILKQLEEWMQTDLAGALLASGLSREEELRDLANWIARLVGPPDAQDKHPNSPRIRDLHKLAEKHYFHPWMLGRTSIKVVLPAVWQISAALRQHPWFADYHRLDEHGNPLDPYKTLKPLPLGDEDEDEEEAVMEGTGAIRVYQDLLFWEGADARYRDNHETLLKQYCKLDTAAMVMIWVHWTGRVSEHGSPHADA